MVEMPDKYMRKKWLQSSPGMTLFAVGVTATMLSLAVFALQDLTILITGKFVRWSPLRDVCMSWERGSPHFFAHLLPLSGNQDSRKPWLLCYSFQWRLMS